MAAPADEFWLLLEAGPTGPFTAAEVKARLAAGSATWGTKACRVGATAWVPLHRLAGVGPGPPVAAAKCVNGARPSRGPRGLRLLAAGVALGVAGVVAAFAVRTVAPGVLAGYERGYGDTILQYKDRSYEGAAWRKLPESAALAEAAGGSGRLLRVAGWDDGNFWVATDAGRLVRHRDGVWQSAGKPPAAPEPTLRVLDRDTLFVAGEHPAAEPNHLYRVDAGGVTDLGELGFSNTAAGTVICPVGPGLLYCFRAEFLNAIGVVRIADGVRTEMPANQYKESAVHTAENVPVPGHLVSRLVLTRHPRAGAAWAVSATAQGVPVERTLKLVRYRSGTWYAVADLPKPTFDQPGFSDMWLTGAEDDPTVVLAAPGRGVHVFRVGRGGTDQPVAPSPAPTSGTPCRVWGVSADKYWVMDSNGTIWERAGGESRVVVRGLRQDDVEFVDAWVSPTGRVVAVTDKHVYRLE